MGVLVQFAVHSGLLHFVWRRLVVLMRDSLLVWTAISVAVRGLAVAVPPHAPVARSAVLLGV